MSHVLFDHGTVTPQPVTGKAARIVFRGDKAARFRLQHTNDRHGEPDDLCWCDVSNLSNGRADPEKLVDKVAGTVRGGFLVDRVEGELEVLYRRHIADWVRVVPFEDKDEATEQECAAYVVSMEPVR
jgi:hypothetical protein